MSPNSSQNQQRLFLAITLSLGVFLLWSYLFPPPKRDDNANANANIAVVTSSPTNAVNPVNQTPAEAAATPNTLAANPDNTPNRVVTIKTPLYEAKIDSRGALVTSWILLQNKTDKGTKELFSASSTKDEKYPLELVSPEGLKRRELPLKLATNDANLDALVNDRNYQITNAESNEIVLNGSESKKIDFVLRDDATQIESIKSLTFHADNYVSDLQTKLVRNNQPVGNVKLLVGPSTGDQGIKHHDYYAIEPEAVAVVDGSVVRHRGIEFTDKNNHRVSVNNTIDWAGVGDTYFAMAVIPAQPANGLEIQGTEYEVPLPEPVTNGIWGFITGDKLTSEKRHLVSAYLPINTDGTAVNKLYVGTKDHFLLTEMSNELSQQMGRAVNLDNFINYYGWMAPLIRPIAIPILWTLIQLNTLTNSYGVAILIFTLLFYSLLFPLRWYQSKSFKKAAKNAPRMKEMQERYKEMQAKNIPLEDPRMRELQMEQLKLTKDAVPIGGCLPMLLQFPLLFAMLTAITVSLDFRQASFMWLPDLSAADPFHILNFGFAGSMVLAMLFTPTAAAITPEQQMQQRMMTYMMPVMMLWVTWAAPSGLLVYWLAGNVIGFGQQMIINRLNKSNDDPPTTAMTNSRTLTKKEMKTSLSPSS